MADFSGTFPSLVTLNDNDRITGNVTFNGGLTIAVGATIRVTGNFSITLVGPITTTETGPKWTIKSELALPGVSAWAQIIFKILDVGSELVNGIIKHMSQFTWGADYTVDNLRFDKMSLEDGKNTMSFAAPVNMAIGEVQRFNGASFEAINFNTTSDVTIARFYNSNAGNSGAARRFLGIGSTGKLRIDEIILENSHNNGLMFERLSGTPTLDIGKIYQYGPLGGTIFFRFGTAQGTLLIGGGILTIGNAQIYQESVRTESVVQNIDHYGLGSANVSVSGGPNHINCAYLGFKDKAIDAFNLSADVGTPDGVVDANTAPFNEDSIKDVRDTLNFPETVTIVSTTPGLNSVSVDFTIRTPGESALIISDSGSAITVNNVGDLSQYSSAGVRGYDQRLDFDGTGKVFTSNALSGNRNLTANALKGGSELRGRIIHRIPRTNRFIFSSEFTFTPTTSDDTIDPTWDDGGPGTDSGLIATDATTDGEVNLSWNTPLDETDVEGVQLFFSTVSGAQAITDGVKRIIPSNITSIRLGGLTNDTEHFFIVRALDKAGNTTGETTGITATPTAISVASPTPGALQAFLTAE